MKTDFYGTVRGDGATYIPMVPGPDERTPSQRGIEQAIEAGRVRFGEAPRISVRKSETLPVRVVFHERIGDSYERTVEVEAETAELVLATLREVLSIDHLPEPAVGS